MTPDARVFVVEHVMGAAIERLRYSHEQYWKELRVAFPRPAVVLKNDQRTDVTQIGVVALSLILGRLLHPEEYPAAIDEIVASSCRPPGKPGSNQRQPTFGHGSHAPCNLTRVLDFRRRSKPRRRSTTCLRASTTRQRRQALVTFISE